MSKTIDKYAPLKKLSKYKLTFKTKPWITAALQKSVSIKKHYLKISLIKKILIEKLNFRLNIKATETCYLPS